MTSPLELWASAGRCWLAAGAVDEALRCFEAAGAWGSLAALYEQKGRFAEAAMAYEQSSQWLEAARCHRLAGQFEDAEQCLSMGEMPIRRAWALVHDHGRAEEAEAVIDRAPTRDAGETSGALLVLARCDVARGAREAAAKKVCQVLPLLHEISLATGLRCAVGWAVSVAELLRRPDLAAHALAMAPPGFEADKLWDAWTKRAFGAVVPPPFALHGRDEGAK